MTAATVVIPTHNHGETLYRSVASALAQTVSELEIFIVGDGASEHGRAAAADLARGDSRIRFFDLPKGPRHGEINRHAALQHARGRIVCYLSDDDLWLPEHVELLERRLRDADFAHTIMVIVEPDGRVVPLSTDAARSGYVETFRADPGGLGLSCVAHTLEAYRRLPEGWRTTPLGIYTDAYMWLQFLDQPWCRTASLMRPTALHFVDRVRRDWPTPARLEELDRWAASLRRPGGLEDFRASVLDALAHDLDALRQQLARVQAERDAIVWIAGPARRVRRALRRLGL